MLVLKFSLLVVGGFTKSFTKLGVLTPNFVLLCLSAVVKLWLILGFFEQTSLYVAQQKVDTNLVLVVFFYNQVVYTQAYRDYRSRQSHSPQSRDHTGRSDNVHTALCT